MSLLYIILHVTDHLSLELEQNIKKPLPLLGGEPKVEVTMGPKLHSIPTTHGKRIS